MRGPRRAWCARWGAAAMRDEAGTLMRDVVAPAYARLLTMIRDEYLTKARTTLAANALPDGQAFYQARIEKHTTLNLTPQQIHDIGLKEVARIQAEMEVTKQKVNFKRHGNGPQADQATEGLLRFRLDP
jgi:uncharacterized protein (DUF885 family)